MQNAQKPSTGHNEAPNAEETLDEKTVLFLLGQTEAALKRQEDHIESVWRTLPFMGALFGLSCTILLANTEAHSFDPVAATIVADILFLLALLAFAIAFRFIWALVTPKDFQFPTSPIDQLSYAGEFKRWLEREGKAKKDIAEQLAKELQMSTLTQLGENYQVNMRFSERRLKERSAAIKWTLAGFALSILSEIAINVTLRM